MWAIAQGSGGTGLSGVLAPLKGKTISCTYGATITASAKVDATGAPFVRRDAGAWQAGFFIGGMTLGCFGNIEITMTSVGVELRGQDLGGCGGGPPFTMCTASWPAI